MPTVDRPLTYCIIGAGASGLAAAGVVGRTPRERAHLRGTALDVWELSLRQVFATGHELTIELPVETALGKRHFQARLAPQLDPDGSVVRVLVVLRECAAAFLLLLVFLLVGERFLALMRLSEISLEIAGGVILFLIALRMIFPPPEGLFGDVQGEEPFIVPLAVPAIAGPSALATVLLLVSRQPERLTEWIAALVAAILVTALILGLAPRIRGWIGERGVIAMERLMDRSITARPTEPAARSRAAASSR